jgi:predicted Fe-Mo cluster-binding NifX family protein
MKIAIASEGAEPDAQVSLHGARAPFYLLYDDSGKLQQSIANPCADAEKGAGPKAAQYLERLGVQIIVAGGFGGRFVAGLEEEGIQQVQKVGIVSEVIADILAK